VTAQLGTIQGLTPDPRAGTSVTKKKPIRSDPGPPVAERLTIRIFELLKIET